ncbi:MAG: hypothetical protein JJT78_18395, partial [Leptospira sp.]|nr:hypothetical protein [Leptospira sp.]
QKAWVQKGIEVFPDSIPLLIAMGDMSLQKDWDSAEKYYLKAEEFIRKIPSVDLNSIEIISGLHPEDKNEEGKRLSMPNGNLRNSIYFRLGYLYLCRNKYQEASSYLGSIPASFRDSLVIFLQILLSIKNEQYSNSNKFFKLFMHPKNQENFSSRNVLQNQTIEKLINSSFLQWKNLLGGISLSKDWIDFIIILKERMNLNEDLKGFFIEKIILFNKKNNNLEVFLSSNQMMLFDLFNFYKNVNNSEAVLKLAMDLPYNRISYDSVILTIQTNGNMEYFLPYFQLFFGKDGRDIISRLENFYWLANDESRWDVFLTVINHSIESSNDKIVLSHLHFYLGKYHLLVSQKYDLAYNHLKISTRLFPNHLAYWGIGKYCFIKKHLIFSIAFFNKSLEIILENKLNVNSIHEMYPKEILLALLDDIFIPRHYATKFLENVNNVFLKEYNSPDEWEFLFSINYTSKNKILLGIKLGMHYLILSQLEKAQEYFINAKNALAKLSIEEITQEDLEKLNEFIFPYRSESAKDMLSRNIQRQLDEITNRLNREREREMEIKNNHLAFLSHTLRNSLAGASGTLERIIDMGVDLQKEGGINNPMFFSLIQDLNKLNLTHRSMDALLDIFKLFTKDRDRFRVEWEREESGQITPEILIIQAIRNVLYRVLFHDGYNKIFKRINTDMNKKSLQIEFLEEIFKEDIRLKNAQKVLSKIIKLFPIINIEINDEVTSWKEYGLKYNVLSSLISEVILNALKYSDYREPIHIKWIRMDRSIHFSVKNSFNKEYIDSENSQTGLKFVRDLIRDLRNIEIKSSFNSEEFKVKDSGIYYISLQINEITGENQ